MVSIGHVTFGQDDLNKKAGLLLERCEFEPGAQIMVLKDEVLMSVNNDYSLCLERHVTFKFFREKKIDRQLADALFYPSSFFDKYYKLSVHTIELDPTSKAPMSHDISSRITSIHLDQLAIKIPGGALLEVSYSINFRYGEKLPDWRFQSTYPTEFSSVRIQTPEIFKLQETIEGGYKPEVNNTNELFKPLRLNNQTQDLKISERYYQFNQLPSATSEPFSDHSSGQLSRMHLHIRSITKDGVIQSDLSSIREQRIIETLSSRSDFLLRLEQPLDIKSDYDHRIKAITDPKEKLMRIYDLVRRHITWDKLDSISAHPLSKVWNDKKGNSTEINLTLIKLLSVYGFDAVPLIVSTRSNGSIDTSDLSLTDFNRTVAYVELGAGHVVLDATGRYYDYPTMSPSILNTRGLLISMERDRWVDIHDTANLYRNTVTLLGHLSGDSSFLTNVYVNSYGYAKPEHVEILENDSLKGLRKYFEKGNTKLRLKHFIAANEYVDTLPLAQEFDIRVPVSKTDNLRGVVTTWFSIPDTLFTITDERKCDINFGYRQRYELVSEFTFPEKYEIYLMPNNVQITAVNGNVRFEREYHPGTSNFSLRQTLVIDKSYFTKAEAVELAKFLRKISNLNNQQVTLKKNF